MTAPAFRYRECNLAMADTTFFTQQDSRHADVICTFLRYKNRRVTVGTVKPLCMLLVGIDDIGHRTLYFTYNIQIHDNGLGIGIVSVIARFNFFLIQRLDPVDVITRLALGQGIKCTLGVCSKAAPGPWAS